MAGTTTNDLTSTATTTTDSTATTPSPPLPSLLSPAITTDQTDYPPGATVTLTGSGWGPGESVHLFVNDTVGHTCSTTRCQRGSERRLCRTLPTRQLLHLQRHPAIGARRLPRAPPLPQQRSPTPRRSPLMNKQRIGWGASAVTVTPQAAVGRWPVRHRDLLGGSLGTTTGALVTTCSTNGGGNISGTCSSTSPQPRLSARTPLRPLTSQRPQAALRPPSTSPTLRPTCPTSLAQSQSDGSTSISIGGTATSTTVVLRATVSDPDSDQTRLQVEVKPIGTAFATRPQQPRLRWSAEARRQRPSRRWLAVLATTGRRERSTPTTNRVLRGSASAATPSRRPTSRSSRSR